MCLILATLSRLCLSFAASVSLLKHDDGDGGGGGGGSGSGGGVSQRAQVSWRLGPGGVITD
ncbi:hypothetical protein E2C01_061770 [Portunus trituberculatus]|uniref:Secreted protein n=1 Tax=Portunus trituberculatus TaxID=210409 RepID=A0A5B7HBW9_PORTR|nr:hypothetical protein [Portunus trituberculatus]